MVNTVFMGMCPVGLEFLEKTTLNSKHCNGTCNPGKVHFHNLTFESQLCLLSYYVTARIWITYGQSFCLSLILTIPISDDGTNIDNHEKDWEGERVLLIWNLTIDGEFAESGWTLEHHDMEKDLNFRADMVKGWTLELIWMVKDAGGSLWPKLPVSWQSVRRCSLCWKALIHHHQKMSNSSPQPPTTTTTNNNGYKKITFLLCLVYPHTHVICLNKGISRALVY